MIALTQEKREELIAHNTEKLKGLKQCVKQTAFESLKEELGLEIQSTEVTLASLTAEPSFTVLSDSSGEDQYTFGVNKCTKDGSYELYTAPPVPEIKLPEKLNAGEIHYELAEKYGLDVSIDQLERGLAEEVYSVAVNNFERLNGLGD